MTEELKQKLEEDYMCENCWGTGSEAPPETEDYQQCHVCQNMGRGLNPELTWDEFIETVEQAYQAGLEAGRLEEVTEDTLDR